MTHSSLHRSLARTLADAIVALRPRRTLITTTAQYAARLLKKPDQCRMVYTCAHLFWSPSPARELRDGEEAPAPGQDGKRALECLQRSLKIADACKVSNMHTQLFVEILDVYVTWPETEHQSYST